MKLLICSAVIPISFEETAYSFQELEMLINSVLVGKEDVVTEQNLTLLVQLSTNGVAREGNAANCLDGNGQQLTVHISALNLASVLCQD